MMVAYDAIRGLGNPLIPIKKRSGQAKPEPPNAIEYRLPFSHGLIAPPYLRPLGPRDDPKRKTAPD
jgi:hypothetical protein